MIGETPHDIDAVLGRIRTGLATVTGALQLEWGNEAFFRLFPGARLGAPLSDTVGPWSLPRVARLLEGTVHSGTEFERLEVADEERAEEPARLLLTARCLPRRPGDGRILLLIEDASPLATDRNSRDQERRLALQNMAAAIAHEFNNLLVGVLGHATFAEESLDADSKACRSVRQIQAATRRAVDLTNRLLLYSGRASRNVEEVDLHRMLKEFIREIRSSLPDPVSLETHIEVDLARYIGDSHLLQQILKPIIENAVESIGDRRGSIRIRAGHVRADRAFLAQAHVNHDLPEGEYVSIQISDTGSGMDRETLARACEPFYSTRFSGRGLGLAAVAGSVRTLGGALFLASRPGHGAACRILLPRSAAPSESAPVARNVAPLAPGTTVLVIEHDAGVLELARSALEAFGFRVVATRDPGEGVAIFRSTPDRFPAALLDLHMPGDSGEHVLLELRRIRPDVAAVLSSGFGGRGTRVAISERATFLKKPYTPGQLLDRLSEAVARANDLATGGR